MKKLFISQPMNGKSKDEIINERKHAIAIVKNILGEDVEELDTYFDDFPENAKPLEYLARSLEYLAKADIAYFAPGWQNARGCRIEHTCAIAYGIPTIPCGLLAASQMNFGEALEAVKSGFPIARAGWNGRGMFVVYQKGYPEGIPCNKQTAEAWHMKEGDLFRCNPYLQIRCVDGSHSMWVPSINDCLANDWYIVNLRK